MILIAPDKFKGTLSASEAANIIAHCLDPLPLIKAPMADGGEGTAKILCSQIPWQVRDCYYVNPVSRTAVIDSSAVIGLQSVDLRNHDILKATSAPLGVKVREILKGGCQKVVIGIGGTATCDGGLGFIEALGEEKLSEYRNSLVGLSDVSVPLLAPKGQPSALMFAPQKGASSLDIQVLENRLEQILQRYPKRRSPFDGAGGGLGFAIASVIGAPCYSGAKFVLDKYGIDWDDIDLIITGEGRIDDQTSTGKVVGVLSGIARDRSIPIVAFGGCVVSSPEGIDAIDTSLYFAGRPLDSKTAALRLEAAVKDFIRRRADLVRLDQCTT